MEEINSGTIEQQPEPTTQPADNGNQGSVKMFTQEEVNEIVRTRLERERKKYEPKEPTETEKREAALTARESRLQCKEHLQDMQLPYELLDILDTSDYTKFTRAAGTFMNILESRVRAALPEEPMRSTEPESLNLGFGFENKKHEPRQFPPRVREY